MNTLLRILISVIFLSAVIGTAGPGLPFAQAADADLPSVREGEQGIRVEGGRISIDVRNVAIGEVLRQIARAAGIDVVTGEGISGEVTLKLTDATIEEALEHLCRNRALVYEYLPESHGYRIVRALAVGAAEGKNTAVPVLSATGRRISPALASSTPDIKTATPSAAGVTSVLADGKTAGPGAAGGPGGDGAAGEVDSRGRPLYRAGELLVKIKAGLTAEEVEALHRSLGSTVLGIIPKRRLQRIRLREGFSEADAITLYQASAAVERVRRHPLRYPEKTADDPYRSLQWGLSKIAAEQAWGITSGKTDVIVAVIDTGVDYNHPDLKENVWINEAEFYGVEGVDDDENGYVDDIRGWDFAGAYETNELNTVADNSPMDVNGHGTHVSGIIAAVGNNSLGIAGVNWRARIMPLKVESDDGIDFQSFAVTDAIDYAVAHGAKIVNCSYGGGAYDEDEMDALTNLKYEGGLAVCAAGNNGTRDNDLVAHYPSGYDLGNIIAVAASNSSDGLASFSHYGATTVDLVAPGVGIYSTILEGTETTALVRIGGTTGSEYAARGLHYAGQTGENGISATAYDCGQGYVEPNNQFPSEVNGNIALIQRGTLTFAKKVENAQSAGAIGVVIYNDVVDDFDTYGGTLGSPGYWVPAVSVTKAIGEALVALGASTLILTNKPLTLPYGNMSGTSMAAPHVSGVAALLKAQCPNLTYQEIRSAILDTVEPVVSVGPGSATRVATGGRLNASKALRSLIRPADLNGDCVVGLADAILALQLLAGLPAPDSYPCDSCGRDVSGDDRIGLEEVFFILQAAAGLR